MFLLVEKETRTGDECVFHTKLARRRQSGSSQMPMGKFHLRGTKCISHSHHGQSLEPGSIRLPWSASRKHRCQVLSQLGASSLCSGSVPGDPEPAAQAEKSQQAGQHGACPKPARAQVTKENHHHCDCQPPFLFLSFLHP